MRAGGRRIPRLRWPEETRLEQVCQEGNHDGERTRQSALAQVINGDEDGNVVSLLVEMTSRAWRGCSDGHAHAIVHVLSESSSASLAQLYEPRPTRASGSALRLRA